MTNKQKKEVAKVIERLIKEEDCYAIGINLVGFYIKEPAKFIYRAFNATQMRMKDEYQKFLREVSIFYNSLHTSVNSDAWVDESWCLTNYFVNFKIKDCKDYKHLMDAICYQVNVSNKCIRLAYHLDDYTTQLPKDSLTKGLVHTMAAMLRQFGNQVAINMFTIYNAMTIDQMSDFHQYYAERREDLKKGEFFWQVPRMDAFFEKKLYFAAKVYARKEKDEKRRAEVAIMHIKEIVQDAYDEVIGRTSA